MNPSLIFLDEPTSGLDSFAAQAVIRKLRELALGGRRCNVLCTIHQPSSEVFHTFHKVSAHGQRPPRNEPTHTSKIQSDQRPPDGGVQASVPGIRAIESSACSCPIRMRVRAPRLRR